MTNLRYVHAVIAFPLAVHTQFLIYTADNSVVGDRLREIINDLNLYWVCPALFNSNVFHVYTVTCEVDVDGGNIRALRDRWSNITILAAWHQHTGLQLGQTWGRDANGEPMVTGTPRFVPTNAQKLALRSAWPTELVVGGSLLVPPNVAQGQILWALQ